MPPSAACLLSSSYRSMRGRRAEREELWLSRGEREEASVVVGVDATVGGCGRRCRGAMRPSVVVGDAAESPVGVASRDRSVGRDGLSGAAVGGAPPSHLRRLWVWKGIDFGERIEIYLGLDKERDFVHQG
ncbi:hypothetical protein E2562_012862 [Oryza meyeriana var. granulata]|uniref:DUF834 domain-containing protein n=1 Tax=Oryza meyeriana var. granulata TaxID=110450 RepID=A0A6G1CPI8_9ORYZ|nr:hypothetical protein E2562_012862 [Oryza meyeriana var. granulata]